MTKTLALRLASPMSLAVLAWMAPTPAMSATEPDQLLGPDLTANGPDLGVDPTLNFGRSRAVAMDADGDFVATWLSNPTGQKHHLLARRFSAGGVPLTKAIVVGSPTSNPYVSPSVASDSDGNFVVTWSAVANGDYGAIYTRRFDAAGRPRGKARRANANTATGAQEAAVAMDASGDFVVAWREGLRYVDSEMDIHFRRYAADGSVGPERRANTQTFGRQFSPDVAMDASGHFVLTWFDEVPVVRAFDADGHARGKEIPVGTGGSNPVVSMALTGDFVVAWDGVPDHEFGPGGVVAQRFDATGIPQGDLIRVSTPQAFSQILPSIAHDAWGDFIVSWEGLTEQSPYRNGIYARRLGPGGNPRGDVIPIDPDIPPPSYESKVSMSANGDWVISRFASPSCCGGDPYNLQIRRFSGRRAVDVTSSVTFGPTDVTTADSVAIDVTLTNHHAAPVLSGDPLADKSLGAVGTAVGGAVTITLDPSAGAVSTNNADWVCGTAAPMVCTMIPALPAGGSSSVRIQVHAPDYAGHFPLVVKGASQSYDPRPILTRAASALDVTCAPGSAGMIEFGRVDAYFEFSGTAPIEVVRSGGRCGRATVRHVSRSGTATSELDFAPASGTLVWGNGELGPKTFAFDILEDTIVEPGEYARLLLEHPHGAVLGERTEVQQVILDDDQ